MNAEYMVNSMPELGKPIVAVGGSGATVPGSGATPHVARRGRSGATIIEVLVAVVILVLGLLPLLLALNNVYVDTYRLGTRSEAQLLAAEKIDELKSEGFLGVEIDYLSGTDSALLNDSDLPQRPYSRITEISYQKEASPSGFVDADSADVPTDYIRLRTTVSWTTADSGPLERTLTAMMTRDGSLE
jgi:hypothetical protein